MKISIPFSQVGQQETIIDKLLIDRICQTKEEEARNRI
jgi:hypothetical protein